MEEKKIDVKNIDIEGNILDIGYTNEGIVYNMLKSNNNEQVDEEISVDYYENNYKNTTLTKEKYDNCVLFFTFKEIWFNRTKEKLVNYIYDSLNERGNIFIWDIDKGYWKHFFSKIKVSISENKDKIFKICNLNFFQDNSKENIMKIIAKKFDIIEFDCNEDIFFIKAKRKDVKDESIIDSD